jgi:nucleoside-diphosphate-sugar epimerase
VTILVTGASGFVGAAVCESHLARGDDVVGIDQAALPQATFREPSIGMSASS